MAKVIRLTESDLNRIVKRVIEEQMNSQNTLQSQMNKVKPEMGGKYCFGNPQRVMATYGNNVILHKIKGGDTLSGIAAKYPGIADVESLISVNRACPLSKGLKGGDVIAIITAPSN